MKWIEERCLGLTGPKPFEFNAQSQHSNHDVTFICMQQMLKIRNIKHCVAVTSIVTGSWQTMGVAFKSRRVRREQWTCLSACARQSSNSAVLTGTSRSCASSSARNSFIMARTAPGRLHPQCAVSMPGPVTSHAAQRE